MTPHQASPYFFTTFVLSSGPMPQDQQPETNVQRFPLVSGESAVVPALTTVLRRLAVARSTREIMETVTQPARSLLGAGGISFVLRDGDFCFYAEEDAISPLWKGKRFPMEACISGWCMREAQAVAIPDIRQDSRIPHDVYEPTFVRSLVMVPVPQDRPFAAMGAYWPEVRDHPEEAIDLLQTLGNAAALAISKVDQRQESQALVGQQRELGHRIKNIFALVEALVCQTRGEDVSDHRTALLERLHALEQVHAELAESATDTADLRALLNRILLPLVENDSGRVRIDGPPVRLPGARARDLAFVICELGTNAVKHGALSVPKGQVTIQWECDGERLRLHWQEMDGPAVETPTYTGFGTKFIKRAVVQALEGDLELDYETAGLRCLLSVPLPTGRTVGAEPSC